MFHIWSLELIVTEEEMERHDVMHHCLVNLVTNQPTSLSLVPVRHQRYQDDSIRNLLHLALCENELGWAGLLKSRVDWVPVNVVGVSRSSCIPQCIGGCGPSECCGGISVERSSQNPTSPGVWKHYWYSGHLHIWSVLSSLTWRAHVTGRWIVAD